MNGRIHTELKPRPGRSVEEELIFRLGLLDGVQRFAFLLWRLPENVAFDRVDLSSGPSEYIQCAGGEAGRFTCEVRAVRPDGARQLVVGRRLNAADRTIQATEVVKWAEHETRVWPNEVLELSEIAEVFRSYLRFGVIPARYVTRVMAP